MNSIDQDFGNLKLEDINFKKHHFKNNHINEINSVLGNQLEPIKTMVVELQVDSTMSLMGRDWLNKLYPKHSQ